ncbi:MAG: acyltransferase [Dorea sp.]|uniref:acyltransferase family protein n=1 Tax=Sporofaciens musculi TaxID=2681861 RepID=UPI002170F765|nr:acyltransferase [Sporofaciens musculi]MCI9422070.1 acyltransferase [Dorea sp.]
MNRRILRKQSNSLNFIRILAASQVMFGHLVEHLELPIKENIFRASSFLRGVPIFFAISGFLIWFSIESSKSYSHYITKRFLRIYPELWAAVMIELLFLMIFYHGWDIKSLILFGFGQGTIFQFWTPEALRGYGVGTPNGALWTIGVMIQFYIMAWIFYKIMKNRKMITWMIGLIISFMVSCVFNSITHEFIRIEVIGKLYDQTLIRYFWIFYIGMFIAEFQEFLLPICRKYWWMSLLLSYTFFWSKIDILSGYYLFWSLFLIIGVIGFAYRFPQLNVPLDISYGLFLYHMTVVNVFVNFRWGGGKWEYALLIVLITVILAYISTVTVGKLSVRKKRLLT